MNAAEAQLLRPGDIVEFRGSVCTWIAKLLEKKTFQNGETDWVVQVGSMGGGFGARLLADPTNFFVVGHSGYRV